MSQKIYRHVLKNAWAITWRYPMLWLFGAFALFLQQSQFFYSLGGVFKITALGARITEMLATQGAWFVPALLPRSLGSLVFGIAIGIIIVAFLCAAIFLAIQSQGTLLAAGDHIFRHKKYLWRMAWYDALEHFWPLTGIFAIKVAATALFMIIMTMVREAVLDQAAWWPVALYVIVFAMVAIADVVISFTALYAACYVVLEKESFLDSWSAAARLFARHWLASLEIGAIFLVLNSFLGIIIGFVVAILYIPLFYYTALFNAIVGFVAPAVVISLCILFIAAWFLSAVYTAWFMMSLVVLFDHMTQSSLTSKVVRWLRGLTQRG